MLHCAFWNPISLFFWTPPPHHHHNAHTIGMHQSKILSRKKQCLHSQNFDITLFLFHNMGITQIWSLKDQNIFKPNV